MTILACQQLASLADVLAVEECSLTEADADLISDALDAASDVMFLLSGGLAAGICTETRRPIRTGTCDNPGYDTYGVEVLPLPRDLKSVDLVVIDGVALGVNDYDLIDGHLLYRKDGTRFWPGSNDLTLDITETGSWYVQYRRGITPDWFLRGATAQAAVALIEDEDRRPGYLRGLTSANVQGASVQLDDAAGSIAQRGLPLVEKWLAAWAPYGAAKVGVFSPDFDYGWRLVRVEGPQGS